MHGIYLDVEGGLEGEEGTVSAVLGGCQLVDLLMLKESTTSSSGNTSVGPVLKSLLKTIILLASTSLSKFNEKRKKLPSRNFSRRKTNYAMDGRTELASGNLDVNWNIEYLSFAFNNQTTY